MESKLSRHLDVSTIKKILILEFGDYLLILIMNYWMFFI